MRAARYDMMFCKIENNKYENETKHKDEINVMYFVCNVYR